MVQKVSFASLNQVKVVKPEGKVAQGASEISKKAVEVKDSFLTGEVKTKDRANAALSALAVLGLGTHRVLNRGLVKSATYAATFATVAVMAFLNLAACLNHKPTEKVTDTDPFAAENAKIKNN